MEDDGLHAVCVECGTESQDTLNVAFDDWQEERAVYERGSGGTFTRQRKRRRAAKAPAFPEVPPEPSPAARAAALGEVAAACGRAAAERCGVNVGASLARTWSAVAAAASLCDPSHVTKLATKALTRDDELWDCLKMETVLGTVYYACRDQKAAVAAWDVERWAHFGLIPWLGGWSTLCAETRATFAGRSNLFRPRGTPTTATLALVAEIRIARLVGKQLPPIDAESARRLCSAFISRLGLVEDVEARATRLSTLSRTRTETGALACVVLACARYHDLEAWTIGETTLDVVEASVPWVVAEASHLPRTESELAAYSDVCRSVLGCDYDPATAPAGAATQALADDLDRLARSRWPPTLPVDGPLFLVGTPARLRPRCRAVAALRLSEPALVRLAARYALCPPLVLQHELDELIDRLDDVVPSDDGTLADLLAADLADMVDVPPPPRCPPRVASFDVIQPDLAEKESPFCSDEAEEEWPEDDVGIRPRRKGLRRKKNNFRATRRRRVAKS